MKFLYSLMWCLLMGSCALAQLPRTVTVKVLDEAGMPLEGAEATVVVLGSSEPTRRHKGLTNSDGVFKASDRPQVRFSAWAEKEGYYRSDAGRLNRKKNHEVTLILRAKKNPIPLYAKRFQIVPPKKGQELGYDFEIGDWVAPIGRGKQTDAIFRMHHEKKDFWNWEYRLVVSFPNEHDGIQPFTKYRASDFKSDHLAPGKGYQKNWIQTARREGKGSAMESNSGLLRGYWLRTRTRVDDEGRVIAANYTKVYGNFPDIDYYFNPTPNDRNLEFDPQRNLFTGLDSTERVHEP